MDRTSSRDRPSPRASPQGRIMPFPRRNPASMASLILQIVWMAMKSARTLGTHFGNNRLQAELLEDIRELLGEARGYRFRGERRDLNRNPGRFPVRRRFGGHRRANVAPPSRRSVVSSTASPAAPSAAPPAAPPSRAPTPPAPPAPVLALPAPPRPRCPLHGDGPCPPPPPSMVASQWLSLGIEPQSPIRYPTPTPSSERAAHSPPPRRPSPPTIAARMSAPTRLPAYIVDPALAAPPPPPPPPPARLRRTWISVPHGPSARGRAPPA